MDEGACGRPVTTGALLWGWRRPRNIPLSTDLWGVFAPSGLRTTGKGTSDSHYNVWWGAMNEHVRMTAYVEQRNAAVARVRLMVESTQRKCAWNSSQDVINETGVRDPKVYQTLFEKIDQSIFIKKNL